MPIIDPVCYLAVDAVRASELGLLSRHSGELYYFCSAACKALFDRNPDQYSICLRPTDSADPENADGQGAAD